MSQGRFYIGPTPEWADLSTSPDGHLQWEQTNLAPFQEAISRAILDLAAYGEVYITVPHQPDQLPHDPTPDRCWRCDALPGDVHLGLCEPCRESLT